MVSHPAAGRAAKPLVLHTGQDVLKFDARTGRLLSLRSSLAKGQEFIASTPDTPVFALQYLDAQRRSRWLDSRQTRQSQVRLQNQGEQDVLTIDCRGIGGLDLDVRIRVRAGRQAPAARWGCTLRNAAGLEVVDVQFPFLIVPYRLAGRAGAETLVLPHWFGRVIRRPTPDALDPDSVQAWVFGPPNSASDQYPGPQFGQFLAYHNDRAGLYVGCHDPHGNVKRFRCGHRDGGMRLGIAHVGDWPAQGSRELEYEVVVQSFRGDWQDACGVYRDWTLQQSWAVPLTRRRDIPQWLLDSPMHITIRPQGIVDAGPVMPVREFIPLTKTIPMLERIARKVDSPLVVVLMGWERAASWVYPDCFPPVGGEEHFRRFCRACRERGWRVGSFCNGTRWVTGHYWNGYDGLEDFDHRGGLASLCRFQDGRPWADDWSWRSSSLQCLGAPMTQQIARDFVRHLLKWGMQSIQFFDQNCLAQTWPCFAADHEHPPMPGKWMPAKMTQFMKELHELCRHDPDVVHSAEAGVNETALPVFQQADTRLIPPGHALWGNGEGAPMYQFLYHECLILHGMMGFAAEPHHMEIRTGYNGVTGLIPGGVLTGDGTLLAKYTDNWAPWEPKVGNDDWALEMLRVVTALRRGPGRDFLVYGRMQKACPLGGVKVLHLTGGGRAHDVPAVFHQCWCAPDGRYAVALANWTPGVQSVKVRAVHLGRAATLHLSAKELSSRPMTPRVGHYALRLPPHSIAILEQA